MDPIFETSEEAYQRGLEDSQTEDLIEGLFTDVCAAPFIALTENG